MKFSLWGYKEVKPVDVKLTGKEGWWGIPVKRLEPALPIGGSAWHLGWVRKV